MLFLLIGVVLVFLLLGTMRAYRRSVARPDDRSLWGGLSWFLVVCLVILILLFIGITAHLQLALAELEAFKESNCGNYETAAELTEALLSKDSSTYTYLVDGSIERLEQSQTVSDRIREWRDAANEYNTELARMKRAKANLWIGIVYPDVDLEYVEVE